MNIYNSGYIPYNPYVQSAYPAAQYTPCLINSGPSADVFQKSSALRQNTSVQSGQNVAAVGAFDDKRIQAIYDKTYAAVMAQNPITKELNIQKPLLNFNGGKNGALATYICGVNEIKVQNKDFFKNDVYLCKMTDANGEIIDMQVLGQNDIEDFKKRNLDVRIVPEKLTDGEKELYISSVFAHELRHCIQSHLLLSTEGCKDEYKKEFQELKDSLGKLSDMKKELAELEGKPYIPGEEDMELQKLSYGLNYTPKKVFDENSLFKFSLSPEDNRYWSIKEHLLSESRQCKENGEYYKDPLEIDAHNYQCEFLLTHARKGSKGALRENIKDGLMLAIRLNAQDDAVSFIRQ